MKLALGKTRNRGNQGKWPKHLSDLTPEQKAIGDDFLKHWLEVLPNRYGIVDRFNHGYPVKHAPKDFHRTLEIGAGLGEHLNYERLNEAQRRNYFALDLRDNMVERLKQRFPDVTACVGDCQARLDFADGYFDRILAIHVLEHLPNLPAAIREMHRLVDKQRGVFSIVIPCEGGWAYSLARRISSQRIFECRYKQPFRWFIEREHLNVPEEILAELEPYFRVVHRTFFPTWLPFVFANLCLGITLQPRS
jgi:SAM-dependent methyltransferase